MGRVSVEGKVGKAERFVSYEIDLYERRRQVEIMIRF